ncbi:MAG TPA: magnesium/cobalt transporter CorA, partial [Planctomycetia bacterium]|nr:magnesium/cobalt transporter CorA [Planctomycetia bacterium]
VWIDVEGLGDLGVLRRLAERFHIHRLALEDIVVSQQRPKVERYDDSLFVVARSPVLAIDRCDTEQISLYLGSNFLVTFQEGLPGDCFEGVRERLRKKIGRIRNAGSDYLAYALIDAVVDAYFPALERLGERLETVEAEALNRPTTATMSRIRRLRRDLLLLRRSVWPLREAIHGLLRDHADRLQPETVLHLRDSYDHGIEVLDLLETYRDLASGLIDVYLSAASNRMNEIMRVLTIVSTIFIPLSFIAGVYGMNFKNMPETDWHYGYYWALALMGVTGFGLLGWFWRRGWLRNILNVKEGEEAAGPRSPSGPASASPGDLQPGKQP